MKRNSNRDLFILPVEKEAKNYKLVMVILKHVARKIWVYGKIHFNISWNHLNLKVNTLISQRLLHRIVVFIEAVCLVPSFRMRLGT